MIALALYLSSFIDYSEEMACRRSITSKPHAILITATVFILLILGLVSFSAPVLKHRILGPMLILAAGSFLAVSYLPLSVPPVEMAITAHLLLILLIGLLFTGSLTLEDRRLFWVSVLLATLLILSRTLEYQTGLLIKAAVFSSCGIGLIIAGVCFERYLKTRRQIHG